MPRTNSLRNHLKSVLRPAWRRVRVRLPGLAHGHRSLEETHAYWRHPADPANLPENYLRRTDRSRFLLDTIQRYARPGASVLELGCNAGRNLSALYAAGYHQLTGVEISADALELLAGAYPVLAQRITLINAPVEDVVRSFRCAQFDVTFSMAVLEHLHTRSEWVFAEIARATRSYLITIEDEQGSSWRHFPRNYRAVFEPYRCTQVEAVEFRETNSAVFSAGFYARVFRRTSAAAVPPRDSQVNRAHPPNNGCRSGTR